MFYESLLYSVPTFYYWIITIIIMCEVVLEVLVVLVVEVVEEYHH